MTGQVQSAAGARPLTLSEKQELRELFGIQPDMVAAAAASAAAQQASATAADAASFAATKAGEALASSSAAAAGAAAATAKAVEVQASATAAAASAAAASTSTATATAKASEASVSAASATGGAMAASLRSADAQAAAAAAAGSAASAATSAATATAKVTEVQAAATAAIAGAAAATTKAGEAQTSATAAAGSATTATTKASEAQTSATAAAGSATTAETKASEAAASAIAAVGSMTQHVNAADPHAGKYASADQGAKANSALQPGPKLTVAAVAAATAAGVAMLAAADAAAQRQALGLGPVATMSLADAQYSVSGGESVSAAVAAMTPAQQDSAAVSSARAGLMTPTLLAALSAVAQQTTEIAGRATLSGYITKAGTDSAAADPNWLRSALFACGQGASFVFHAWGHPAINCISFYNQSGNFISGDGPQLEGPYTATIVAPANTVYARLSFGNSAVYPQAVSYGAPSIKMTADAGGVLTEVRTIAMGAAASAAASAAAAARKLPLQMIAPRKITLTAASKILLYGESISSTDYPWYKSAMEAITGATVYNGGFSGASAGQLAADARTQRILTYGANLVIVMVGGNDYGNAGSVGTFSGYVDGEPVVAETSIAVDYAGQYFIQAVSHIIRKFKASYYNIRARAGLTGSETEAQKEAKIDAVLKPHLVLCSPLPQQRTNAADQFSLPANWARKRDAVAECCLLYGIPYINLTDKCGFDMSLEPYWVSPTDMGNNRGIKTMDGLHPNKYGYDDIARIVCAEIGL